MEKLIRQNINLDRDAKTRTAHPDELDKLLGQKMVEEAYELSAVLHRDIKPGIDSPAYVQKIRDMVDEAADVVEVVNTVLYRHGIRTGTIGARLEAKHHERGGFIDRVLIDAPANTPDAQLRSLVEDTLRALVEAITGSTTKTSNRAALASLHQRAHMLGCLGTNAKNTR